MLNKKPEQYSSQEAYTADVLEVVKTLQKLDNIDREIQELETEKAEIEKKISQIKAKGN